MLKVQPILMEKNLSHALIILSEHEWL